jgi:hypothetical protein
MNANTWAMLCHLSGLLGYTLPALGSILGPLIIWIVKKDEMPAVDEHGKEALNFNLSILIYSIIVTAALIPTLGFAFPLFGVLIVFHIVCVIVAALRANSGQMYRYPLTMRIIR